MSKKSSDLRTVKNAVKERALEMAKIVHDRKGSHTVIYDLRGISPITDFFIITTGLSILHTRAIAEYIHDIEKPYHMEGMETGHWILLDYVDFIVHIFTEEIREFYGLERLWGDAPVTALEDDTPAA